MQQIGYFDLSKTFKEIEQLYYYMPYFDCASRCAIGLSDGERDAGTSHMTGDCVTLFSIHNVCNSFDNNRHRTSGNGLLS